jgi:hypothetical protein
MNPQSRENRLRERIPGGSRGLCPRPLYLRHGHGQGRLVQSEKRYLGPDGCAPAQPPKSARIVAMERVGRWRGLNHTRRKRQADRPRAAQLPPEGWGPRGNKKQVVRSAPRGGEASQHVAWRDPGELAESTKSEPLQPRCIGTSQFISETCTASKPVPEGNVWHQGLASAVPRSC